jgi:hypothetical protein
MRGTGFSEQVGAVLTPEGVSSGAEPRARATRDELRAALDAGNLVLVDALSESYYVQ